MVRFSKHKQKAYRKRYYSSNEEKALQLKSLNYKCNADLRKESDRASYLSRSASKMQTYKALNRTAIRSAMRDVYVSNPAPQKEAVRQRYTSNPSPKRKAVRQRYTSNPSPKRKAVRQRYACNPSPIKNSVRQRYTSNLAHKKEAARRRYRSNPAAKIFAVKDYKRDANKRAAKMQYLRHRSAILLGCRRHYYASVLCKRAARLRRHALHRSQDNKKSKA